MTDNALVIGSTGLVGSLLINALTNSKKLAKISGKPGKTQLINHFLINEKFYFADLPGYGYAKISKKIREEFQSFTLKYLKNRENLMCLFLLIDLRVSPQKIDLELRFVFLLTMFLNLLQHFQCHSCLTQ